MDVHLQLIRVYQIEIFITINILNHVPKSHFFVLYIRATLHRARFTTDPHFKKWAAVSCWGSLPQTQAVCFAYCLFYIQTNTFYNMERSVIIMAILKHISSRNSSYLATIKYLSYKRKTSYCENAKRKESRAISTS